MIGNITEHITVITEVEENEQERTQLLQTIFGRLTEKLEQHITKEEQFIFPFVEKYCGLSKEEHLAHFPELRHTVDLLLKLCNDQKSILDDIKAIRDLTNHYQPEITHSPTHKLCFEELLRLELKIQQHFSLVKNELVKKLEELEDKTHREEQVLKNDKEQ